MGQRKRGIHLPIAYFISPHGFGHAARAAAVMAEIHGIDPAVRFDIFTTVPRWFFQNSLSSPFSYHSFMTDIGMVQKSSLHVDYRETSRRLNAFLPFDDRQIAGLAQKIGRLNCKLIICDISPMGIAVGKKAGIPSLLIENFTWDWIYEECKSYDTGIGKYTDYLNDLFNSADFHIQAEPVCSRAISDLTTFPISRKPRTLAREIRASLEVPEKGKVVMITMGGVEEGFGFLEKLTMERNIYFVIAGVTVSMEIRDNLVLLPRNSPFFHPDLVNASDAVVGKVGYSTLAEVYHSGIPFGYITRPNFPESGPLADFIQDEMKGLAIEEAGFHDGTWISRLPDLLNLPSIRRDAPNGAEEAARFVCSLLTR
jgi:hypothetical protein